MNRPNRSANEQRPDALTRIGPFITVCVVGAVALWLVYKIRAVLLVLIAGVALAYALAPLVRRDYLLFYEYFHGDNGAGIGTSHQTGWTGLVARLIHGYASQSREGLLERGSGPAAFLYGTREERAHLRLSTGPS